MRARDGTEHATGGVFLEVAHSSRIVFTDGFEPGRMAARGKWGFSLSGARPSIPRLRGLKHSPLLNHKMTTQLNARSAPSAKPVRRYFTATIRILMGLAFLVFGLNAFLNFIPQPATPLPEKAVAFAGALMATGYMIQLIGVTHMLVGALLVLNRFVPLALVLLAPFLVNSVLFHAFIEPSGLIMAGVFWALELYLAWSYRAAYGLILTARATPV